MAATATATATPTLTKRRDLSPFEKVIGPVLPYLHGETLYRVAGCNAYLLQQVLRSNRIKGVFDYPTVLDTNAPIVTSVQHEAKPMTRPINRKQMATYNQEYMIEPLIVGRIRVGNTGIGMEFARPSIVYGVQSLQLLRRVMRIKKFDKYMKIAEEGFKSNDYIITHAASVKLIIAVSGLIEKASELLF